MALAKNRIDNEALYKAEAFWMQANNNFDVPNITSLIEFIFSLRRISPSLNHDVDILNRL
ncbi:hypothetical protein [Nitrosomonas supralitoralis]|uniref:Uncharacterized protein n=1 Tax=Nitrosomonas supralitoralis TaxID=2116706 RepID=A0A2P7NYR2_9PROT|nr:hypothetical protein [Nitrosomonas supralitoralis]PSJ18567.1 hypothetical protein C7H79_01870 [Nitrosomonas supralitoralis]